LDENYRSDVHPRPRLPRERGFTHGRVLPSANAKKNYKKSIFYFYIFYKKFLVVVAGLEREKLFTIYNLQFSVFGFQSPNFLNSPSSAGFAGEATRRRRFFRPSSPSHPSKLYSSLGWLNSKVPKPFPPFSLKHIDVDGF
jgi:hypothetical protein